MINYLPTLFILLTYFFLIKWIIIRYIENIGPAVARSAEPVPPALKHGMVIASIVLMVITNGDSSHLPRTDRDA